MLPIAGNSVPHPGADGEGGGDGGHGVHVMMGMMVLVVVLVAMERNVVVVVCTEGKLCET